MLRQFCLNLCEDFHHVFVMGRGHEKLIDLERSSAYDPPRLHGLMCDYTDEEQFFRTVTAPIAAFGNYDLIVCWVHSTAPNLVQRLLNWLPDQPTRVIHVQGSASQDPSKKEVVIAIPAHIQYQEVILGFQIDKNGNSRWLSHEEICDGVWKAYSQNIEQEIVGTVRPWSKRP